MIFYFKFGEKVSALHFIGVMMMLSCVLCISLAASKGGKTDYNPDDAMGLSQTAAGLLAVSCGLLSAIFMSTKHLFIRLYKSNYSGVDMGVDASGLEFLLLSFFLIPLSYTFEYTWMDLLIGSIAGILIASGRICISIGISVGLAGPAQSLMSTHSLH